MREKAEALHSDPAIQITIFLPKTQHVMIKFHFG